MNTSNQFKTAIEYFLNQEKLKNPKLEQELNNPAKNLDNCCNFILAKVKAANVFAMVDIEVYSLALEYFLSSEPIEMLKTNCKVVIPGSNNTTIESHKEGTKKQNNKELSKNNPNICEGQMSIFDFL